MLQTLATNEYGLAQRTPVETCDAICKSCFAKSEKPAMTCMLLALEKQPAISGPNLDMQRDLSHSVTSCRVMLVV